MYKRFIIIFLLFVSSFSTAVAQPCYKAIYIRTVKNDFAKIAEHFIPDSMKEVDFKIIMSRDRIVKDNPTQISDSLILALNTELSRMMVGLTKQISICSPGYKKLIFETPQRVPTGIRNTYINNIPTNYVEDHFDMKQFKMMMYVAKDGDTTITCKSVDTSKLHFLPTGKTKRIGNWDCAEYKTRQTEDRDFSIWACAKIPNYVSPFMFGINIDGGIVQLEFSSGNTTTLSGYYATDNNMERIPCTNAEGIINLLDGDMRHY